MAGCDLDVIHCHSDVRQRSESGMKSGEKVSGMSVGGVFSYPRPRRERGVDSPGVRAVGERPWWNGGGAANTKLHCTLCATHTASSILADVRTTCTVRNVRHTQGM